MDEHLAATGQRAGVRHVPRRYQGEFLAAAEPAMAMTGEGWPADGSWHYRLSSSDREFFRGECRFGRRELGRRLTYFLSPRGRQRARCTSTPTLEARAVTSDETGHQSSERR